MKTFWAENAKRLPKWSKSITLIDKKHMAFRYLKILMKPTKTRFLKSQKRVAKTLIKPVENEDFLSQNRKMASEMIKKALRL